MAKHAQKPALRPWAGTDWKMIGAIVGVGVLALVGLLAWASSLKVRLCSTNTVGINQKIVLRKA